MEATENSNYLIQDLVDFIGSLMFETFFKLFISIDNDVMRSFLFCVHKFLERSISSFLEKHIIIKGPYD